MGYIVQTIGARLPDDGADLNDGNNLGPFQTNFADSLPAGIRAAWARKMLKTNVQTPVCNGLDVTQDPPAGCGT